MITYHPWYDDFRPDAANRCLAEAAELGAGYIRLDVRWKDLLPDGNHVDEAAWTWYEHYLLAARNWYGLEPLIVLYNPPNAILNSPISALLSAWTRYVDEVAKRTRHLCSVYQLLNEPNNPVYQVFPLREATKAIVTGTAIIRQCNPQAKVTINVLAGLYGWERDLETLVRTTGSAIDIVGLDYYPGTWTLSSDSESTSWDRFTDRIASIQTRLNKRPVAILETGYATNVGRWRGEDQQVRYLLTLKDAVKRWDKAMGADGPVFLGVHELSDGDTGAFLDPEAHFGLLTSTSRRRKAGFEAARQLFRSLQRRAAE